MRLEGLFGHTRWRIREDTRVIVDDDGVIIETIILVGSTFWGFIIRTEVVEVVLYRRITVTVGFGKWTGTVG